LCILVNYLVFVRINCQVVFQFNSIFIGYIYPKSIYNFTILTCFITCMYLIIHLYVNYLFLIFMGVEGPGLIFINNFNYMYFLKLGYSSQYIVV